MKGFSLVFSLLILSLLLVMGLALMGVEVAKYRGAVQAEAASQALALAEAGMEDARVKLNLDPNFFPKAGTAQAVFSYSEQVQDSGGQPLGSYFVTVDKSLDAPWLEDNNPYRIIQITSVGQVGPASKPIASRTLHAEIDADPSRPGYFRFSGFQDDASY